MKIEELAAIRDKMKQTVNTRGGARFHARRGRHGHLRHRRRRAPVLNALTEVAGATCTASSQTGCIGICQYEPVVEITYPRPGKGHLCKDDPRERRARRERPSGERQSSPSTPSATNSVKEEKNVRVTCNGLRRTGCTSSDSEQIIEGLGGRNPATGLEKEVNVIRTAASACARWAPSWSSIPRAAFTHGQGRGCPRSWTSTC